ncbi:PHD/FYVE-zinc-finger like domain-containing protein [Daldinia bambusicola]|nr:PHD/FYVE-zinc-finger like domain-containing protein [Daldinia bambusicola]
MVAYDDVLQLKNGPRAAQQFQNRRFDIGQLTMDKQSGKRPLPEDEYYDSEPDDSDRPKKRTRESSHTTRRSTRQASRQASVRDTVENDVDMDDVDETIDDSPSDEEFEDRKSSKSRRSVRLSTLRVTRSNNPALRGQRGVDDSEDELVQDHRSDQDDEYEDVIPVVHSDLGGTVRTSSRKRRRPRPSYAPKRRVDSGSEIEFETARRSKRSTRVSKSMRDPEIDDEYEAAEDKIASAPKIAAIKEVFEEHPENSKFQQAHRGVCDGCGSVASHAKGPLIPCQGCSYSFHKGCISVRSQREHRVTKVGPNNFVLQCRFCIELPKKKDKRAPSSSACQYCRVPGASCAEFSAKRTPKQEEKARLDNGGEDPITFVQPNLVNNPDNVLFRCFTCRRAYHFHHLPQLTEDPGENRLEKYSFAGWKCRDCLSIDYRIHALVAWRPSDQDAYVEGQRADEFTEDELEYLVKWEGRSHIHNTWMPGAWVHGIAAPPMRAAFHRREENEFPKMATESAVREEWVLIDVILNVRYKRGSTASSKEEDLNRISDIQEVFVKFQGLSYEEAVWDEPPPRDSETLWAAFTAAYDEFLNGKYFPPARDRGMRERISNYRSLDFQTSCELKSQPPGLKEGRILMPYQMEGVNWLLYNFHQQQNVILADEMGLGKTIQIVSFISSLVQDQPKCWPFLIVVPNATCPNWRRELKDWSPGLRVVTYHGGKVSQDLAYRHELFPDGVRDGMKAHVVIMSYEAASSVKTTFQTVKWAGLIVDEGQRLKNEETQLYRTLTDMNIPCRILLTGTPLQNNKKELFTLLQFIDSKHNAEELDAQYSELTKDNLPELHNLIRPYFLRRTKAQVLKFLPPMARVIVPVTMTVLQEKLSKSILSRNPELIKAIIFKDRLKASDRKNLSNIMADLRQCLCHPFCFSANVEDKNVDEEQTRRNLIEASPKFMLLEKMLPKLKAGGHRVLIFSQFLRCLDIIEDFLNILGLPFGRIDGSLSALKKQRQIDAFNAPNSPLFAMLLSTRAGGVGINLATADTVIIYDPDWNPHQDIQAISRAHRIGQKEKVLCFQLTTKDTVEENILQAGKRKMALDHALIESLDADNDSSGDLESIIKRGTESLFTDKDKAKITYDSAAVDKLLDRSRINNENTDNQTIENQFSIARVWANESGALTDGPEEVADEDRPSNTTVWENILKTREEQHQRDLAARQVVYGRGARRRGTQVSNSFASDFISLGSHG